MQCHPVLNQHQLQLTQAVSEAGELFPGAERLHADLLEVRLAELRERLQVDLVPQEEVSVLRQALQFRGITMLS